MQADFALAVDPIFESVLSTLAQLSSGQLVDAAALRAKLLNLFDRADALQGTSSQWQLAKYALAAWIDEMLLSTPWAGAPWWRDHILEMEFFQTRICSVRFFELAEQASAQPRRDALEVYVNCVQLGFRGALASGDGHVSPRLNESSTLPGSLDGWLKRMQPRLEVHALREQPDVAAAYPQRIIEGAPPLPARQHVIWWALAVAVMLLANGWVFQSIALPWAIGK